MPTHPFFDEAADQSVVKATLVAKYFWSWAKVIIGQLKRPNARTNKLAYIDLFAGPGRYQDGTKSTPILILERAIADPDMRGRLITMFNDIDANHTASLQTAINGLPGVETLRYPPKVYNQEVGSDIVEMFEQMNMIPTFFFVDPWGYKGFSLRLINSVLKNWGSDCIFFFNYNRINMGLANPYVQEHMDALFGQTRAGQLRQILGSLPPDQRELTIVEELSQALKALGGEYVLPFRFRNENGTRTSHHLIFVSKHPLGYQIMKEIMAGESSSENQGVATFEYNPASSRQPLLFSLARPLDDLADDLLSRFAGRTLTMQQVYEQHNIGTPKTVFNI